MSFTGTDTPTDIVVVGAGPAAWAAAAAVAEVGLAVALVAPAPTAPWPATYGVWVDELDGLGLGSPFRAQVERVEVVGEQRHVVERAYAVIDNGALAARLARPVLGGGGHAVVDGCVVGSNHDRWRSTVVLADGRTVTGRVVVDASGATPILVQRAERPKPAHQVARGIVARFDRPVVPAGTVTLMDLSSAGGAAQAADERDPTFLYALELGDGTALVEETSLARRPPLGLDVLDRRLAERLARLGAVPVEVVAIETPHVTMGGALPSREQREVGFGAAAAMVHPATGYSVAASLRAAPRLARALADALDGRRATPASASRAGWDAVWPAARRRAWRLERYGLDVLVGLDAAGQRRFFDAFFELPVAQWSGYLSGTLPPADVGAVMREVFARLPWSVRAKLVRPNPLPLLAAR